MTSTRLFTLETGSRLHFGLWGWGPQYERQFGGVGMVIDPPRVQLDFAPAVEFEVVGPALARVRRVAEGCIRYWGWGALPPCRIEVAELPPQHVGLGVGTQLDLSVARGLAQWQGLAEPGLAELALAVDRGGRSSVGTHGFDQGGLVVEAGRAPGETLGKLLHRQAFPDAWRVVLMTPRGQQGLSGARERQAFAELPAVPVEVHERLLRIACDELVPAAAEENFDRFASNLYDYGRLAGECYATVQEVPYSSRAALQLVERLRADGVAGVAQSSWGPTLFAIVASDLEATELVGKLVTRFSTDSLRVSIASPRNSGARITAAASRPER